MSVETASGASARGAAHPAPAGDARALRRALGTLIMAAIALALALLAAPAAAPAATSCAFASGTLSVDLSETGDEARLFVFTPTDQILVINHEGSIVGCTGDSTVMNTGSIAVSNRPGVTDNVVVVLDVSQFAPGLPGDEHGGDPEIEIRVNLNDAPGSWLEVFTPERGGAMRFGSDGINPNAVQSEVAPDADSFPSHVPAIVANGGDGPDLLSAQGGAGTGAPMTSGVVLFGGGQGDLLVGGEGDDTLRGGPSNDALEGMGGDDVLAPDAGVDIADGGPGSDTADFVTSPTGVSVDLTIAGLQPTGHENYVWLTSVENANGSPFDDVLRGDDGPNALYGAMGEDVLDGCAGQDALEGREGADTLLARDGGPDRADCGDDVDTVTAALPGVDILAGCEHVLFAAAPPGGAATPGTTGTAGASRAADTLAPAFRGRVRVDPARFRVAASAAAARGTRFRYSLTEPATVTFAIERKASGRMANGRCRAKNTSNAARPRCTLFRRIGSLAGPATAGANATRFTGRIAGTVLGAGFYRVSLTAVDAAGNRSKAARANFEVLKRGPARKR